MTQNQQDDFATQIVKAMSAGSAALYEANLFRALNEEIEDKYASLKSVLQERYPQIDADTLDIGPGAAERKAKMMQQLREHGAANDADLRNRAAELLKLVSEEEPGAVWASKIRETPSHLKD